MKTPNSLQLEEKSRTNASIQSHELNVVTGAFGYSGRYITHRLLAQGKRVVTLTGHVNHQNPFGDGVSIVPFSFDNPGRLAKRLRGATTLFNTYWVRFPYGQVSYDRAIENTMTLIEAAEEAGISRIVHISVTNASADSPLPYFRGKGLLEKFIAESRLSYAIIRPTLIFGLGDVLINNIAWLLRRFPVFVIPGSGGYKLQPIYVEDLADIALDAARKKSNMVLDAVGPEVYMFDELVRLIAVAVRSKARIVHCHPKLALLLTRLMGHIVKDVVLTEDEVDGLMENQLVSAELPSGRTSLRDWLIEHGDTIGIRYASELDRHYRHPK